jgi:DNA-binding MarR family transcriptional regulator
VIVVDHVDRLVEQWQRERPDLDLDAMALLGRLGRLQALAGREVEAVLQQHGLNVGEFDVLAALRRAGAPNEMAPSALARLVMLSPAGMTNRVDRLEAAGLVERRADPEDRRSQRIALTAAGRKLVDAAVTDHVANEVELLSPLTKAERKELDRLVRKLLGPLEGA